MKKVKSTAIKKTCYPDLMARYENPILYVCNVGEGQVWISNGWAKQEGTQDFCFMWK